MGTLVHDPFFDAIPSFFGLSLSELLEQKHPTAWASFEKGELNATEYCERMFADQRRVDAEGLKRSIRSAYRWLEGMESLLVDLADAHVEMHALSNYPAWYALIEDQLGVSRYVAWTFVSCKTGVRKPDAQAYLGAAQALGRRPADCLFIDDRLDNCVAAERVGMPAIVFESASSLRRELELRGVLRSRP